MHRSSSTHRARRGGVATRSKVLVAAGLLALALLSSSVAQAAANPPICQAISNTYGVIAGQSWGAAPTDVQQQWIANNCSTTPSCQALSEVFGIVPGQSFGAAPQGVRDYWIRSSCGTNPSCQALSHAYGIVAGQSFGSAPQGVRDYWVRANCGTSPVCAWISETQGTIAGKSWGKAPAYLQQLWIANRCGTTPSCQGLSNTFGIIAGKTFGSAPAEAQDFWINARCSTSPSCQSLMDNYGIVPGQSFGSAPQEVRDYWLSVPCGTSESLLQAVQRITSAEFIFDTISNCHSLNYGVSVCGVGDTEYYTWTHSTCNVWTGVCTEALTYAQMDARFAAEFTAGVNAALSARALTLVNAGTTYGNISSTVAINGVYPASLPVPFTLDINALQSAYARQVFGFQGTSAKVLQDGAALVIYVMGDDAVFSNNACVAVSGNFIGIRRSCAPREAAAAAIAAIFGR